MSTVKLGARAVLGDRPQTLGLLARDAEGRLHGLTAVDPATLSARSGTEIPASALIVAVPLDDEIEASQISGNAITGLAALSDVLNESLHRHHPDFGSVRGVVTALRGAVRASLGGKDVHALDLIEVSFDKQDAEDRRQTPELHPSDAGCLVTTWEGAVLGLLVGGQGHVGYLAPVATFLAENGLVLQASPAAAIEPGWDSLQETMSEMRAGLAALSGDLAREPSLDLEAA